MKKTLILLAAIFMALPIFGQQLKFSNMIGDNMVLQQSTTTRIWGYSAPNAQVKATASWTSSPFSSKADNEGHWILKSLLLPPDSLLKQLLLKVVQRQFQLKIFSSERFGYAQVKAIWQ